jgi:hypothetical protein
MLRNSLFLLLSLAMITACGDGNQPTTSSAGSAGSAGSAAGGNGGVESGGSAGSAAGGSAGMESGGSAGSGAAPSGLSVKGIIEDETGKGVGGTDVLCCSLLTCYTIKSTAVGSFTFNFEASLPVHFVVKTLEDTTEVPRRAATMFPLHLVEPVVIDTGKMLVPSLPDGAALGPKSSDPQKLEVGDGLELTVSRADLMPPIGGFIDDIAARKIPLERVPPLPDLGAEEVIAVYALHPFTTTSKSPIAVRAPSDLPAGTKVKLRTINEYDGTLSAPAEGQADGAEIATLPAAGIEELTWLVISK